MLTLDATTKTFEIDLDGAVAANQLPVTVSYTDITTTTCAGGASDTTTNSTTAVTIVAAPAASTQRHVETLTVYNADTASAVVTISLNNAGGTLRTILKVTLGTLYNLIYERGQGWKILDASGNLLTSFANLISDTAYAASWDAVTTIAPSKNAVYDEMELKLDIPGAWTTPAFDAGDFTASGSQTWTVAEGDVITYAYIILGKIMTVAFDLNNTTVGGTPSTGLIIAIPASKVATKQIGGGIKYNDNGTNAIGLAYILAAATTITLYKIPITDWSASTDNSGITGQVTFEID